MAFLGSGVGGGMLAAAGALNGLGQGITEVGREGVKEQQMAKSNAMAQAREEAITRLQGQQQKDLSAQGAEQNQALETNREKHEDETLGKQEDFAREETGTKLKAASAAAGATREFEAGENAKNRQTQVERSKISAGARIGAAEVTARGKQGNSKADATNIWEVHKLSKSAIVNGVPTTQDTQVLLNKKTGKQYVQYGDKFIPADADGTPHFKPEALARAPAGDMQALLKDPLGKVPSGSRAGMDQADAFEDVHGYLPAQWTRAAVDADQAKRQQSSSSNSFSLPSALVKGLKGTASTKVGSFGGASGEENPDSGAADNAAAGEEEEDNSSQPFQSQAMGAYGNAAQ